MWGSQAANSSEAGALDCLAEVFAGHLNFYAHFGKTGAHAVAEAIAQSLLARGAFDAAERSAACGQVGIVGGDNGGLLVVVAGVEDERNGVPDPLVRLLRA